MSIYFVLGLVACVFNDFIHWITFIYVADQMVLKVSNEFLCDLKVLFDLQSVNCSQSGSFQIFCYGS